MPRSSPRRLQIWLASAGCFGALAAVALPLVVAGAPGDGPVFIRTIGKTAQLNFLNDPMGVAVSPGDDGRVYVVDRGNARVEVFNAASGQAIGAWGSRGTGKAQFWLPSDIAVSPDGRFVYVVDEGFRRILRFEPGPDCLLPGKDCFSGDKVLTFGVHGELEDPVGLAVDAGGRIYVADRGKHQIIVYNDDGTPCLPLSPIGEPGTDIGQLLSPSDVAIAPDGTIWVADTDNNRISFFTPDGKPKGKWEGGGRSGSLYRPTGIAIDRDGGFVVRDYEPSYQLPQASRWESNKKNVWSVSLGGEDTDVTFPPQGVAFLPGGVVLLTDPLASIEVLKVILPGGDPIAWGGVARGRHPLQFDHPAAVALDPQIMAVVDAGNKRVTILDHYTTDEKFVGILGPPFNPAFDLAEPKGVAIHRTGPERDDALIYVTDAAQHTVYIADPNGNRLARWGDGTARSSADGFKSPHGIAVAPNGDVYIADTANNRIVRRAGYPANQVLNTIGKAGSETGKLSFPSAVAYGPGDRVYTLEINTNRLQAWAPDGTFIYPWVSPAAKSPDVEPGDLWMPVGLGSDAKYLYILESDAPNGDHVRVQVVDPQPGVPLADSVIAVFPKEGPGPGIHQLWDPLGVAAIADGWVAVADGGNDRVQLYRWTSAEVTTPTPEPTSLPTDLPPSATATSEPATPVVTDPPPTSLPTAMPTSTSTAMPTATLPPTDPPPTAVSPSPPATAVPSTATRSATPTATATANATATATTTSPPASTGPTPINRHRVYMPLVVRRFIVGTKKR